MLGASCQQSAPLHYVTYDLPPPPSLRPVSFPHPRPGLRRPPSAEGCSVMTSIVLWLYAATSAPIADAIAGIAMCHCNARSTSPSNLLW